MANDSDLELAEYTNQLRNGNRKQISTASMAFDVGNKGFLDADEAIMRKHDTNNDGNLDINEIKQIAVEIREATSKKKMYKKYLMAACCLLLLSFLGNFGLTWGILNFTRQIGTRNGGLVDVGTGEMVSVQSRGLSVHPIVLSPTERMLSDRGQQHQTVARFAFTKVGMLSFFETLVAGGSVHYYFDLDGTTRTGSVRPGMSQTVNGECVQYSNIVAPPLAATYGVTCCNDDTCDVTEDVGSPSPSYGSGSALRRDASSVPSISSEMGERRLTKGDGQWPCLSHGAQLIYDRDGTPIGCSEQCLWECTSDCSSCPLPLRKTRRLLSETDFASEMEKGDHSFCLDKHYELAVQAVGSHLILVGVPEEGSDCSIIAADAGYSNDGQMVFDDEIPILFKHITTIERNSLTQDEKESMLYFGNVMTLRSFHTAIQSARTSASKNSASYGIVGNCATFVLDVISDMQIDLKKKKIENKLINFVVQAMMKEDRDYWRGKIEEKISSRAVKVWVRLHGDSYVFNRFGKTFLKNYAV